MKHRHILKTSRPGVKPKPKPREPNLYGPDSVDASANIIEINFNHFKSIPHSTQLLLDLFCEYSGKVEHVTEFGCANGASTCAFLMGRPKVMVSYDIRPLPRIEKFILDAHKNGINYKQIVSGTLGVEIDETDLLFVDDLHTYKQVILEMRRHSKRLENI